jgi:hypothetical protein
MSNRLRVNRRSHNPAQEYIVIVGGPSNTYNGWCNDLNGQTAQSPPADASDDEIRKYCKVKPPGAESIWSHDLYWANFLYAGIKLIETGIARPDPGDILTYLIYMPAYKLREERDWSASPYNLKLHGNSKWVAGQKPYDPRILFAEQGKGTNDNDPPAPVPGIRKAPPSTSEPDIDFEIGMRTIGELVNENTYEYRFDGGFHCRLHSENGYQEIFDVAQRIVRGAGWGQGVSSNVPPLHGVLVKLLFFSDPDDIVTYLIKGTWTGSEYIHPLDTRIHDENWENPAPPPYTWTAYGLMFRGVKYKDWDATPSIDRSRVKIRRLDYFGHSTINEPSASDPAPLDSFDTFLLQYGWENAKGEVPEGEVELRHYDLETHLSKDLFTKDSVGKLWGCHLAMHMAPMFAKYMSECTACIGFTTYEHILEDYQLMPEPAEPSEGWVTKYSF